MSIASLLLELLAEAELAKVEEGRVAATVMSICDYGRKDIDLRLAELRNEFDDAVAENMHRHIGKDYCLDIFVAEGPVGRVRELIGRIRGTKGIHEVKTVLMSLKASGEQT